MWRAGLPLLLLLVDVGQTCGMESPQRRNVYSVSRTFVLDVNPVTQVHQLYSVWDRKRPLWTLRKEIQHDAVEVSNDGNTVAVIAWPLVPLGSLATATAISFCNKDGVFKSYTVLQLCPTPPKIEVAGVEYYVWRSGADLDQDGRQFWVATSDGYELAFALADGQQLSKVPAAPGLTFQKAIRRLLAMSQMALLGSLAIFGVTGLLYVVLAYDMLRFLSRTRQIRFPQEMESLKRLVARNMLAALAEILILLIACAALLGGAYEGLLGWSDAPVGLFLALVLIIGSRLTRRLEGKVRMVPVIDPFLRQEHEQVLHTWQYKQLPDW